MPIDLRGDCESLINALQTTHAVEGPKANAQVQSIRDDLPESILRSARHVSVKFNPADVFNKGHDAVIREMVFKLMGKGKLKDMK